MFNVLHIESNTQPYCITTLVPLNEEAAVSVLTCDDWSHNSRTVTQPIYPLETADPSYGPT